MSQENAGSFFSGPGSGVSALDLGLHTMSARGGPVATDLISIPISLGLGRQDVGGGGTCFARPAGVTLQTKMLVTCRGTALPPSRGVREWDEGWTCSPWDRGWEGRCGGLWRIAPVRLRVLHRSTAAFVNGGSVRDAVRVGMAVSGRVTWMGELV